MEQVMVICVRRFAMDAIKTRIEGDALVIEAHGRRAFAAAAGSVGVTSGGERLDRCEAACVAAIAGVLCRRRGGSGGRRSLDR
jgi:hypothetical protein